jgi:hypothetical protein
MTNREAIAILELQTPLSHEDVRKAFRRMAKIYHPDLQREPDKQEEASKKFIAIRQASEWLLSKSETAINSPEPIRREPSIIRRPYKRATPQPKIKDLPIIKELDNVILLVELIIGKRKNNQKRSFSWKFSPSNLIGKWYESLIEKHYPGEDKLQGFSFAIFRFFRLFIGSIFLIAGFFLLSVIGLLGAVILFPPFMVFYLLYTIYIAALEYVTPGLNKKIIKGDLESWIRVRRVYLFYRSFPLSLFLLASWGTIAFGQTGTIYLQSISWLICIPVSMLIMSVLYEWIHFRKIQIQRQNNNSR